MARAGADGQRLFVAIELPPPVRAHLVDAVARVQEPGDRSVRWSAPETWHLTLVFCGSVPTARRAELDERLSRAARRGAALELKITGSGRFGNRVLWAGVDGDRSLLSALAASVAAAARRCGIEVDERPYRPHLTLARGAPGADLRPAVDALRAYAGPPWRALDLALVRSDLGAGPGRTARHEVVATWPLGGTGSSA